jgi:hypothetical protein
MAIVLCADGQDTRCAGLVIYTGPECRAAMNNSKPRSKVGLIDQELNGITKVNTEPSRFGPVKELRGRINGIVVISHLKKK